MSEYLTAIGESLSTAATYVAPILAAMWRAAGAAIREPSVAWVIGAFCVGWWLPRKAWEAPPKTLGGAALAGILGFVIAAAIGALLVGGV